ncbi:MAG: beta-galactosidase GalA [Candidatus Sulfotelmatobacter sp.]
MSKWTRRGILKAGLAASASAASPLSAFPWTIEPSAVPQDSTNDSHSADKIEASLRQNLSCRERILLDFDWRFHLGHASDPAKDFGYGAPAREMTFAKCGDFPDACQLDFNDSDWRRIDLPHDWAVELPFKNAPELPDHGGKPLGRDYPETSIGWYRRVFDLQTTDNQKRISVEFDGVFRDAIVIFNGFYLGRNFSGYAPFRFDLSDLANFGGKNVLTVRVDATLGEGWFYEGAGIYRHVWLTKTAPVHLAQWGTFVKSKVQNGRAQLSISSAVQNQSAEEKHCSVISRILNGSGETVASARSHTENVMAGAAFQFESQVSVEAPQLWSLDEPNLYRLSTEVYTGSDLVDQTETPFGIRSIRFDPDKGFFLNEKPVKIKGTCNHQDHAGVGTAMPDRLHYYRVGRLKEMGSNAYRTSHNPPAPELLDACDRLGMLVLDETRMMCSTPEGLGQLERMIRRDRNHPSVIMWSLGNEEWAVQGEERGRRIVESMRRLAHTLDPSRPVTVAMDSGYSNGKGIPGAVDVQGFNYQREDLDAFHRAFPVLPTVGTETAGTYCTRGVYISDKGKGYVSAYDLNCPDYGATAEKWWSFFADREYLGGGFVWTGFDYRGEPSPYSWPCISSHFGAMDTCGFPKDNYFYYQAWWGSQPVLHLFPHWNWSGKEGQEIEVWCHTNLDRVELFLNGTSLGAKSVRRNSHLEWKVKYTPGVLEARGSRNGRMILTDKRETTGAPDRIVLRPDRQTMAADGADLSVTSVEIVDARGRTVPTASNQISFSVSGPGRVIGVGNGDPSCHEADKPSSLNEAKRSAFNGLCMALVQSVRQAVEIRISAASPGLSGGSVVIQTL